MALFTSADRDAVKTAILTAVSDGFADIRIGNQEVRTYTLGELQKLLQMMQSEVASSAAHGGMRSRRTVPPECG